MTDLTINEFIMARIDELQMKAEELDDKLLYNVQQSYRDIMELHRAWPILLQEPPTLAQETHYTMDNWRYSLTTKIEWLTQQQYITRFGKEPPTTPFVAAIAKVWRDHEDYHEDWA